MDSLIEFWAIVVDVWSNAAFGASFGRIVIGVGAFALFLVVRHLFARFVIGWLKRLAAKTTTEIDDRTIDALDKPLRFVPIVFGFFIATEVLELQGSIDLIAGKITRSLVTLTLFWGVVSLVEPLSFLLGRLKDLFSQTMVSWFVKAIKILFMFIGVAAILDLWGIKIGPILAGLGLFGLAGALAAQDLLKNLLSGVLVLAERRFQVGDWIRVDGVVEGTVETIGFRSTAVRQFDKALVQVPNAALADNAVINFSKMTHRRIYWKIGVVYGTTVDQLRYIRDEIEAYILNGDDFAKPPEVSTFVRIDSFGDSSIDIMLYCFTKTTVWGEWLAAKERLAYRVKEIVGEAKSEFAFPSTSLYVESYPDDQPEAFRAPAGSGPKTGAAIVESAGSTVDASGDGDGS
ncbi:MAG: mechanosensitive ion channel family protein [Alphaproteobacteria bacterium]|nr:mechanosensitive ion channel family protein [Alphaproteobacteria bacterium]MCZ6838298.1 mechanosensitive ion channel family protein [Alphaproteobacteria bacterium]